MRTPRPTPPWVLHRMEASLEADDTESRVPHRSLSEPRGSKCICVLALGNAAESMAQFGERRGSLAFGRDVQLRRASCVQT